MIVVFGYFAQFCEVFVFRYEIWLYFRICIFLAVITVKTLLLHSTTSKSILSIAIQTHSISGGRNFLIDSVLILKNTATTTVLDRLLSGRRALLTCIFFIIHAALDEVVRLISHDFFMNIL